ncbi:MAG: sigma 54-interacting transcriptional regulator, partial [Acidobacteriota bacterium]
METTPYGAAYGRETTTPTGPGTAAPPRGQAVASGLRSAKPSGAELRFPPGYLPGESAGMRDLYRQMRFVARTRLPVLIHGETGVGKEPLASTLHRSSNRADGPFVAVNAAAIPNDLLEAEMFGVGVGVATGVAPRPGIFRQAHGGSLFLDEVGEMGPRLQTKLLRVLQEKEIRPLGGRSERVDVRILAATNADLRSGGLRRDLYFRLAGVVLGVPPLRHRPEDLPALADYFLGRFRALAGGGPRRFTAGAIERLGNHGWPGNVRELEHAVQR